MPDYEQQRFTVLGDWRNFVRGVYDGETVKTTADRPPPRRRGRGRTTSRQAENAAPATPAVIEEREGRVAIRLTIE